MRAGLGREKTETNLKGSAVGWGGVATRWDGAGRYDTSIRCTYVCVRKDPGKRLVPRCQVCHMRSSSPRWDSNRNTIRTPGCSACIPSGGDARGLHFRYSREGRDLDNIESMRGPDCCGRQPRESGENKKREGRKDEQNRGTASQPTIR